MIARVPNVRADSAGVEVALESGVRVTGRVTSGAASQGAGPAVAGALVRTDAQDHSTLTDPDGTYVLEHVEPGETTIEFSRDGLLPAKKRVTLSGTEAEVDAQLGAGASIAGVVVSDGGAPVADASVVASSADFAKSAHTDGSGSFVIEGAAPGHYSIAAQKSGYADATLRDVDIPSPRALRLVLSGGSVIAGHVTGLAPAELHSASVQAYSADGTASANVDDRGAYRIEGAPAGTVRVSARFSPASSSLRTAPMQSVHVDPGATVNVDFDFTSDITINGRVARGGVPAPGAVVSFIPKGASQRYARTSADGGGRYEITGIDEGAYTVSVSDLDHPPWSKSLEVSGSATFDVDIRGAALSGRVVDAESGNAIANAVVELRRTDASEVPHVRTSTSDAGGAFSFEPLSTGTYEASARKSAYGGTAVSVSVDDSGAPPVELKLKPAPGLTLHVVDARDQRPLTAWVHIATESADLSVYEGSISGDDPARLPLADGAYRVTVGATGYAPRTFTLRAPGEQTLALTPGGTIVVSSTENAFARARLVDATGQPYRFGPGPFPGTLRIDPAPGQTPIRNVAAGSYTLQLLDDRNNVLRATQITVGEGEVAAARL
jgi:hypothetical protein